MAKKSSNNPLTGQPPNTFTKTDQQLAAPVASQPSKPDPKLTRIARSRRQEFEASGGGAPEMGYNKPEGMSHHDFYWMMGQHHNRGPAAPNINTPHESDPGIVVNRRAEDLSGQEHARGVAILKKYGTTPDKIREDIGNTLDRAVASSVKAGAPRPAGSLFYGGRDERGEESYPVGRVNDSVDRVVAHPRFPSTGDSDRDRHLARAMMTVANSKTSPNVAFRDTNEGFGEYSPNNMAAEAAVHAGLDKKPPPTGTRIGTELRIRGANVPRIGVGVYPSNMKAAAEATRQLAEGTPTRDLRHPDSGNVMFNPTKAPKTTDYQGAHQDPEGPDQKTVVDVHEGTNAFPHMSHEKSLVHEAVDANGEPVLNAKGKRVRRNVHPDELSGSTATSARWGDKGQLPKSMNKELPPGATAWRRARQDDEPTGDPVRNKSRIEGVLAEGKNVVNALVDHAARQAHTERGMSPSVNSANFVHQGQAARWTQRQIERPDLSQSIENQYGLPAPHEHMWSGAAAESDAINEAYGHTSADHMHMLTTISDYEVPRGHPWAGHSAPKDN